MASITAAAIVAAGSVASGAIGASAASDAASVQAKAGTSAAANQMAMFQTIQKNLAPFVGAGQGAVGALSNLTGTNAAGNSNIPAWANSSAPISQDQASQLFKTLLGRDVDPEYAKSIVGQQPASSVLQGILSSPEYAEKGPSQPGYQAAGNPLTAPLTKPFTPADLTQTPGYQFTLDQGLKATQNSYAAKGLASSGAALKGAADYSTGLASTTYNQQLQNYLAQNQQIYNMVSGVSTLGENAAAQTGSLGVASQTSANALTTGAAAAQAGGIVGSANALTGGLNGATNAGSLYALSGSGMFGAPSAAAIDDYAAGAAI